MNKIDHEAAVLIQKTYRGYRDRCLISRQAKVDAVDFLAKQSLKDLPRAVDGETPVYFPPSLPQLIFKEAKQNCSRRLKTMIGARLVCQELAARRLVIPRAVCHGDFLIEQRLPIQVSQDVQAKIYVTEAKNLDRLVSEFVHFALKMRFGDYVVPVQYSRLKECPEPRSDNVPLFYDHGVVKMGLIDLEHVYVGKLDQVLKDLVFLFPLHAELIKREASKVLRKEMIEALHPDLIEMEKKGKQWLEFAHNGWIEYKRKRLNQFIDLPPDTLNAIVEAWKQKYSLTEPEVAVLKAALNLLNEFLNVAVLSWKKGADWTLEDDMQSRTRKLDSLEFECVLEEELEDNPAFKTLRRKCRTVPAKRMLESLAEHKVIYHMSTQVESLDAVSVVLTY